MRLLQKLREFRWGYLLLSLLLTGLGICFIVGRPRGEEAGSTTLQVMAIAIGILTVLYAAVFAFFTLQARRRSVAFGLKLAFAIVVLIAGLVALIFRDATVSVILNVLSLVLVVDGSFKLNTAILCRRYVVFGWWCILVLAFVMIGGGFVLLLSLGGLAGMLAGTAPADEGIYWVLALLLFCEAAANLFSAFYLGRYEVNERRILREELMAELAAAPHGAAKAEEPTAAGSAVPPSVPVPYGEDRKEG